MNVRFFYHSLVSDWNHGNAHFLRGIVTELRARGHHTMVFEPKDGWSRENLRREHGEEPLQRFRSAYPGLGSICYDPARIDVEEALDGADLVIVHEWNPPELVRRIGEVRRDRRSTLLFHDTHHRLVTAPETMRAYDLQHYDGVLAYGQILRKLYLSEGLARRAWTWHEAADTQVFYPRPGSVLVPDDLRPPEGDLVWIGNWGDEERSAELREFLIEPVKALGLKARVYGVRYPEEARAALAEAGIEYAGWLPNFDAPDVFARFKVTLHVPRRPYVQALPGIPTIRPFEALACGIPLVSSPWEDREGLFRPGTDFLVARDGREMAAVLRDLVDDTDRRRELARNGLQCIRNRHTCAHRVDELVRICSEIRLAERRADPELTDPAGAFLSS